MARRKVKKGTALEGSKREKRMAADLVQRANWIAGRGRKIIERTRIGWSGVKRWYVTFPPDSDDLTPYAAKERRRRRAARRVAHESRRVNR